MSWFPRAAIVVAVVMAALAAVPGLLSAAHAAPLRVTLLRSGDASDLVRELTARTAGEVVAAGLSVEPRERPAGMGPGDAAALADEGSSVATIVIAAVPSSRGGEPRVSGGAGAAMIEVSVRRKVVYRAVVGGEPMNGGEAARVLGAAAVRAVAVLQAALGEHQGEAGQASHALPPPHTATAQPAPKTPSNPIAPIAPIAPGAATPPPAQPAPRATATAVSSNMDTTTTTTTTTTTATTAAAITQGGAAARGIGAGGGVTIGAGAVVLQTVGGIGPSLSPQMQLGHDVTSRVAVGLRAVAGGTSVLEEATAGAGRVRQQLATIEIATSFRDGATVRPLLIGGVGLYHLSLSGSGVAPYVGRNESFWGACATGGIAISVALMTHVSLLAASSVLWVWPQPLVVIGTADRGGTGRPLLMHGLGLVVRL